MRAVHGSPNQTEQRRGGCQREKRSVVRRFTPEQRHFGPFREALRGAALHLGTAPALANTDSDKIQALTADAGWGKRIQAWFQPLKPKGILEPL